MQAVRYLQLEPTIDTTIDVEVEELCTNTVFPAAFPVAIKTC